MKTLRRVVWSEGMYLSSHHFQLQTRYFEDSLVFAASSLWYKPYGLVGCELDADALKNGTVSILHARGVFPDGLCFDVPGSDPAPEPRAIAATFSPTREYHDVVLGIPTWRQDQKNVASAVDVDRNDVRFVAEARQVTDEMTGRDERALQFGRKNLRLLLDFEIDESLITLPLARVRRDGAGRFVYDSRFVPPLLQIGASEHVMSILNDLCNLLDRKASAIDDARPKTEDRAAYYRRDVHSFWFLHTINCGTALLRHQLLSGKSHPEELYRDLVRLGGALSCFDTEGHPRDLPLFDHDDFGGCLSLLDRQIRAWLELKAPTNCVSIPLKPTSPSFWNATIEDVRYFERSRWILGVRSGAGEATMITKIPLLVKICSEAFINRLVVHGLPGLALTHLQVPPSAVPPSIESQYFAIANEGPCWEHIVRTKRIGIYVPDDIPNPKMEIHIVMGV